EGTATGAGAGGAAPTWACAGSAGKAAAAPATRTRARTDRRASFLLCNMSIKDPQARPRRTKGPLSGADAQISTTFSTDLRVSTRALIGFNSCSKPEHRLSRPLTPCLGGFHPAVHLRGHI